VGERALSALPRSRLARFLSPCLALIEAKGETALRSPSRNGSARGGGCLRRMRPFAVPLFASIRSCGAKRRANLERPSGPLAPAHPHRIPESPFLLGLPSSVWVRSLAFLLRRGPRRALARFLSRGPSRAQRASMSKVAPLRLARFLAARLRTRCGGKDLRVLRSRCLPERSSRLPPFARPAEIPPSAPDSCQIGCKNPCQTGRERAGWFIVPKRRAKALRGPNSAGATHTELGRAFLFSPSSRQEEA